MAQVIYTYKIKTDVCGVFDAEIQNTETGQVVCTIDQHDFPSFPSLGIRHKNDVRGIEAYLKKINVLSETDLLQGGTSKLEAFVNKVLRGIFKVAIPRLKSSSRKKRRYKRRSVRRYIYISFNNATKWNTRKRK